MKKILIIAFSLLSASLFGQTYNPVTQRQDFQNDVKFTKTSPVVPWADAVNKAVPLGQLNSLLGFYLFKTDTAAMLSHYPKRYNPLFYGIIKLNTDTAATKAYARSVGVSIATDTTHLSDRINAKGDTATINQHIRNLSNPHQVTKTQVGLSSVTNNAQWYSGNHPTTTADYGLPAYPDSIIASGYSTNWRLQHKIDSLSVLKANVSHTQAQSTITALPDSLNSKVQKKTGYGLVRTTLKDSITTARQFTDTLRNAGTATVYDVSLKQNTLTNPITGTGTAGQVTFWNSTSTQTGDAGLTWDNTNKRLGVGVTIPLSKLHVETTSDATIFNKITTTNKFARLDMNSANEPYLQIRNSSAVSTIITSSGSSYLMGGNVGIGTTSPGQLLSVNGNTYITGGLGVGTANTTAGTLYLQSVANTSITLDHTGYKAGFMGAGGNAVGFEYDSAGSFWISPNTRANIVANAFSGTPTAVFNANRNVGIGGTITGNLGTGDLTGATLVALSTGNVGIGTTSPTASLHLKAGTATASTAPLKFTSGTHLTTPEVGAMEWDGTNLEMTQTSGATRKILAYTSNANIAGTGVANYLTHFSGTSTIDSSGISYTPTTKATVFPGAISTTSTLTVTGATTAASFIKSGGTSAQYLLADGSTTTTSGAVYKGQLNGSTGVPLGGGSALADGTGTAGWYYACSTTGTYNYGSGNITLAVGDQLYYNGTIWLEVPGAGSYTLPVATGSVLGGVKSSSTVAVDGSGAMSVSTAYDPSGTNTTHAALTTAAHGLGASAFHADSYFAPAIGSSSITTLGTIGTGVWNGTVIAQSYIANLSDTLLNHYTKAQANALLDLHVNLADTASMLSKYARKQSPTFTGTVVLPSTTSIGSTTAAEIGYLDATSSVQTQINGKQATLVSGTNIKTINGTTLLGSGDLSTTQNAAGVSIADAGTYYTATNVETALQELRPLINANTAKVTNATHTGDVSGSGALTLATVNSNIGSYTDASITVNGKGLITAASSGSAKVAVADTLGMLSKYVRKTVTINSKPLSSNVSLSTDNVSEGSTNKYDKTVALSNGTGITVSGTYPNFTITNSSTSSGGSVTSVATGLGLSGGTITGSGTLAIDTTVVAKKSTVASMYQPKGSYLVASDISGLAVDTTVVHKAGVETIRGAKTFNQSISNTASTTYGVTNYLTQSVGGSSHQTNGFFNSVTYSGSGNESLLYGSKNYVYTNTSGTIANVYGDRGSVFNNGATITQGNGVVGDVINNSGTLTGGFGVVGNINISGGNFNKATGVYSNLANSSTDVTNNDLYGFYSKLNNTGVFDGYAGLQIDATNTGTARILTGLQVDLFTAGGTTTELRGIDLGVTHAWTGTPTNSYGIYIDPSTNIGSSLNYAIYSGSTAPSYFVGSITGNSFVKSGGTSSQFLKADGSVDTSSYVTGTPWTALGYLTTDTKWDGGSTSLVAATGRTSLGLANTAIIDSATLHARLVDRYSPTLYGVPAAPTAAAATSTTQVATTAFVTTADNLKIAIADTTAMLSKYARKVSPTLTGTVVLPSTTSIGTVSSTEIGYVDGVTSAIQTQFTGKQNTLTNPVTTPNVGVANYIVHSTGATTIDTTGISYVPITKVTSFPGNVGIGTVAPATLLDINPGSSYAGNPTIRVVSSTADGYRTGFTAVNSHTGGTTYSMFTTNTADGAFGAGKFVIANATIDAAAPATARLAIDNNGNVGIGTTSPAALLSVGSSSQFQVSSLGAVTAPNFTSNVATGTAPYATTSTTLNTNLNADLLDGHHYSDFVPYTGATGAVNLGAYDLTVNGLTVGKGGGGLTGNTAIGGTALHGSNSGAGNNTAIGYSALYFNTTGYYNTAIGLSALTYNTTGYGNTAIGYIAGGGVYGGATINPTSYNSIYIGSNTTASADGVNNEMVVGTNNYGRGSNTATWGNTSITDHYFTGVIHASNMPIAGSFSQVGTATTAFTVTIGSTMANTTYKVNVTPTSALSAALFYVTSKTTTTFTVTYLAGLTGAVSFDFAVFP